jgi:hypothetical protein
MANQKHLLVAMTNPVAGKDAEFNKWYDEIAYPTYKSLPGLVPLGRFRMVDVPHMFPFQKDCDYEYLSLYYFESDDPAAFLDTIKATFPQRPQYEFSPDIDQTRFCEPIYVAIGDMNFEPLDRYEHLKT